VHISSKYCVPVRRLDEHYVPDESATARQSGWLLYDHLAPFLRRHYRSVEALLEFGGIIYTAQIFEPKSPDDFSYALIEENGFPASTEEPSVFGKLWSTFEKYFRELQTAISFSESFPPTFRSYLHTEFVQPQFRMIRGASQQPGALLSWKEARLHGRLVLRGAPGIGKTSCLRRFALEETLKGPEDKSARLPIYVQLRQLAPAPDLFAAVKSEFAHCNEDVLNRIAQSGRLLLLLDGADELAPDGRQWLWREIENTVKRFPRIAIHVTVRDSGFDRQIHGFTQLLIEPFDLRRQQEWISKRVDRCDALLAKDLFSLVKNDKDVSSIAGNPLLLAIAAAYIERVRALPSRSSMLLQRYIEALLDDWDQARGITRWAPMQLSKEAKLEILCRTAFKVFERQQPCFFQWEFEGWEAAWSDPEVAKEATETLWRHTGILTRDQSEKERWCFSHSMLEEFLAAKYLVERPDNLFPALAEHVNPDRLNAVWSHACAMTQDATPLFQFMMERKEYSRIARATLIARAVLEEASIPKDILQTSCEFLADVVTESSEQLSIRLGEVEPRTWILGFSEASQTDQQHESLRAVFDFLTAIVNGASNKRKMQLAACLATKGTRLCQILSVVVLDGGVVRQQASKLKLAKRSGKAIVA
jgi:hypothetical protein